VTRRPLFVFLAPLLFAAAASAGGVDAVLTDVRGRVDVHTPAMAAGEWAAVEDGFPLESGDHLRTGADGAAEITLNGDTVVYLDGGAELEAASLDRRLTRWLLTLGRFTAKVRSLGDGERFEVETPVMVAAVRGTEFAVSAGDKEAGAAVFDEGKVWVTARGGAGETLLTPGQETEARDGRLTGPQPLHRFLAQRARIERARSRLPGLRRAWRPLSNEHRREARGRLAASPRSGPKKLDRPHPGHRGPKGPLLPRERHR
jgi:hypothetical protein